MKEGLPGLLLAAQVIAAALAFHWSKLPPEMAVFTAVFAMTIELWNHLDSLEDDAP